MNKPLSKRKKYKKSKKLTFVNALRPEDGYTKGNSANIRKVVANNIGEHREDL
jgi:hypothetical protein